MKDKDIINMFDHIRPEVLDGTDLGAGEPVKGLDLAGKLALKRARAKASTVKRRRWPLKTLAAVAVTIAIIAASIYTATAPQPVLGLTSPEYPQGVSYHDTDGNRDKRQDLDDEFLTNLGQFAFRSAAQVFAQEDPQDNLAYSPLSLFYALALAAEGAQGQTQAEMLQALHMPDMDLVGRESAKLFKHLYTDNEMGKLLLANSLWLQENVEFNPYFLDKAAQDYYAYSFMVNFSDQETPGKMSHWISEHTGGKLGRNPQELLPGRSHMLSIINTVYFYDQWSTEFNPALTNEDSFTLNNGREVTVPFMHKTSADYYVETPDYLVTSLQFKNDQHMLLILPRGGLSPQDILGDPLLLAQAMTALGDPQQVQYGKINLALPKFNFISELDLEDSLNRLGIVQAFTDSADFTGIANDPMWISSVQQNLSIAIDEMGCEATAFTKIDFVRGGLPPGSIDFLLDRPFVFAITGGAGDAPLFIGAVNNPAAN